VIVLRDFPRPLASGAVCELSSDVDAYELLSFAASIGIPRHWLHGPWAGAVVRLNWRWRARALRAGARVTS
jgi:hypothetical protein